MVRHRKGRAYEPWETVTLGALRDRERFEEFVHQAYKRLLAFAYQLLLDWDDANDAVQDALLELWELVTKRLRQPNANALAFVYQQIKWCALDIQRKRQPISSEGLGELTLDDEPSEERSDLSGQEDNVPDIEGIVIALEKRDAIHKCGLQLQGRAREVFLCLMQGASQVDIAKQLGISKPRVSQLMEIIYTQLRHKLRDMGWECNETRNVPINF